MANDSGNQDKPAAPVFDEVATAGAGIDLSAYIGEILRPRDEVLSSLGGDLAHYERLMRDHQVRSCFQQRRDAVVQCEWAVEAGGDAPIDQVAADFLETQLNAISWDDKTKKMLSGVFFGYAVAECMYKLDGGLIGLAGIRVKNAKRFRWDKQGQLRLLKAGMLSEPMPERKFWTFSAGADDDEDPYGRGLAHWLYWPVFLKRNGAKFWAIFLEKFASPTAVAEYPRGATDKEIDNALAAAMSLATDAAVALPQGFAVKLVEALRNAGGDYLAFAKYWDNAVAKIILSQTGTTDTGPHVGTANAHNEVRDAVVKADADLICESFNAGPARWLTEWNFPGAKVPRVWRQTEPPEDLKAEAERDKVLYDMGFEPTEEYVRQKYGDGWVKRGSVSTAAPKTQEFAEGTDTAIRSGDALDELAAEALKGWEQGMQPIISPIEQLLADCQDAEEFKRRLPEILGTMDVNQLAEVLAQSCFAARAVGEVEGEIG